MSNWPNISTACRLVLLEYCNNFMSEYIIVIFASLLKNIMFDAKYSVMFRTT